MTLRDDVEKVKKMARQAHEEHSHGLARCHACGANDALRVEGSTATYWFACPMHALNIRAGGTA